MNEKNTGFEVRADQRQSWLSIAMVWAGGMICVPCLMIGGVLVGGGLSFAEIVLSVLLGYGMICAYMIFIGMQACDTGLPVSVMASGSLGEKGARFIISTILALACVGWFGIQSAVCGSAFATMGANMLGLESASPAAVTICSIVWGGIMLLTACLGFKGLKWLNYIAVPALVVVCLYGIIASMVQNDGGALIAAYNPPVSSGLVFGMSMVVASFALGGVISADYCRFARNRGDVVKSSLVGVIPAGLFMLLTGGVMSIVTGQYDISAILASLGVPFFGLIALVLATWTTNVTNAGGLRPAEQVRGVPQPHVRAPAAAGRRRYRQLLDHWQGPQGTLRPARRRLWARPGRLSCRCVRSLPHGRYLRFLPRPGMAQRSLLRGPGQRHRGVAGPLYAVCKAEKISAR